MPPVIHATAHYAISLIVWSKLSLSVYVGRPIHSVVVSQNNSAVIFCLFSMSFCTFCFFWFLTFFFCSSRFWRWCLRFKALSLLSDLCHSIFFVRVSISANSLSWAGVGFGVADELAVDRGVSSNAFLDSWALWQRKYFWNRCCNDVIIFAGQGVQFNWLFIRSSHFIPTVLRIYLLGYDTNLSFRFIEITTWIFLSLVPQVDCLFGPGIWRLVRIIFLYCFVYCCIIYISHPPFSVHRMVNTIKN